MKRAAAALAAAALLVSCSACAPRRPETARRAFARDVGPEDRSGVRRLGMSWLSEQTTDETSAFPSGILIGRFAGAPYDLGYSSGRLARPEIRSQEALLEELFAVLVPGRLKRSLIRQLSAYRLRGLPDAIPDDLLVAIAGLADGYEPVPPPAGWNAYRRMLDMHALHDVSQRFVDAPALAAACTGFLATGGDGSLLLARNFDFEGGDIFDRQKLVSVVVPADGIPYLSVGFAGMLGVVSGFNRAGIGVAINAIAGGETAASGMPMTLLLAEVLARESTFVGAVARLESAKVFVSDLILLGDAKTGRFAIVEKSPSAFAVRESSGATGAFLGATNEPEDPRVRRVARCLPPGSTSRKRRARLDVLLDGSRGSLDVPSAIAILRDRKGADGRELGPGNRNAIDASIASHSVVLDLTHRRAWVAASPHTLGSYLPVDLEAVLASPGGPPAPGTPFPADAWLSKEGYGRYLEARAALVRVRRAERERKANWLGAALREAKRAHERAPDFAEATAKLGELEARRGNRARARALLGDALAHDPGPAPLHAAVQRWREACAAGGGAGHAPPLPKEPIPTLPQPDELLSEKRTR
ncbi:MAG: C45 family peptidase [Acidobacteriota bacterium]